MAGQKPSNRYPQGVSGRRLNVQSGGVTRRARRNAIAQDLASVHDGLAHRADLRRLGVTRQDVRTEVAAGRWHLAGRQTVVVDGVEPRGRGRLWQAVWESGAGAVLDGPAALVAAGMTGFTLQLIDVAIPKGNRSHEVPGVRRRPRRDVGPLAAAGIPRTRPEWAVIRAAQWAGSQRAAALLICLVVQQRLVHPTRLNQTWTQVRYSPQRDFITHVIQDVCEGAHSLGELDFAGLCRSYGLPPPTRQQVCHGPGGRVYLDAAWEEIGLVVEIDGGHHQAGLNPIDDALRQNDVSLSTRTVLRIPLIGLRIAPDDFMRQVATAYRQRAAR